MTKRLRITQGPATLAALGALVLGIGFGLPRFRPIPRLADSELSSLRREREELTGYDDGTLANLRKQAASAPPKSWDRERFEGAVGTGWRVEWQSPQGGSRAALLFRSEPRIAEWTEYLRFLKRWTNEPGVMLESFEINARGPAQLRELSSVRVGLRVMVSEERIAGPGPPREAPAAHSEPPDVAPVSQPSPDHQSKP